MWARLRLGSKHPAGDDAHDLVRGRRREGLRDRHAAQPEARGRYINGTGGALYVAQLTEALTQTTMPDGTILVNPQYVQCRYFVLTSEILLWSHSEAYWARHGVSCAEDADRLAAQSFGVQYSFWGSTTVPHSTIKGEFGTVSEKLYHRSQLVRFSVDGDELEEAREVLSGGPELPLAEEEAAAAEAATGARLRHLSWHNRHAFVNEIRAELEEESRKEQLHTALFGSESDD